MGYLAFLVLFLFVLFLDTPKYGCNAEDKFDENYKQIWGGDHLIVTDQGLGVQLQLDQTSGAGFSSKTNFGSGIFEILLKTPNQDTEGVVTSYHLTSIPYGKSVESVNHFEVDIEIFGRNLSTNIFTNDPGNKEQQFNLWFNPSDDFHKYQILWNEHQIVWFVDGEPIRVWKNATQQGVKFPSQVGVRIEASIRNASLAGEGVDWSKAPFTANYKDFTINACAYDDQDQQNCYSGDTSYFYWNAIPYWQLNASQQAQLANHRKYHLYFDYCTDSSKAGPECNINK
ncbi:OLC1v1019513C1 [Oldenlandia corymbosa var. corymbosa]|uniref:OLC1v1019513C1 n=1 Tax=Oldenlandia corymbosa var. corymbosa TaxID=529605 RepID=A0AAV1EEC0_OLDCO|nr:OLC1v1019513C1 [Oldenlandia corymbosa var. corymbosa]